MTTEDPDPPMIQSPLYEELDKTEEDSGVGQSAGGIYKYQRKSIVDSYGEGIYNVTLYNMHIKHNVKNFCFVFILTANTAHSQAPDYPSVNWQNATSSPNNVSNNLKVS